MITWRRGAVWLGLGVFCGGAVETRAEWLQVVTPHFTVVSEASESRTKAWAVEFELFRRGLETFLPVDPARLDPVLIVLFRTDREFKPFKPLEKGKPAALDGFFVRLPGRSVLATRVDGARDDTRPRIYHEAVHWYLTGFDRVLPLWMEEGLAEMLASFALSGNSLSMGMAQPEYVKYVRVARAMPFRSMMAVAHGSLQFNGKHADQTQLFYAQATVAMHELLFSADYQGKLWLTSYLHGPAASDNELTEFTQAFHRSAEAMDQRLATYLEQRKYSFWKAPLDREGVKNAMVATPAVAAEIDLALGNVLLGAQRRDEGRVRLERAAQAMPADPRPLEALGTADVMEDQMTAAARRFREAERLGAKSYLGCFVLGQAALRAWVGGLDPGQLGANPDVRPAVEYLARSLTINPRFEWSYQSVAALAPLVPMDETIITLVREGARRFPANWSIQLGWGFCALKQNNLELARAQLQRVRGLMVPGDTTMALAVVELSRAIELQAAR